MKVFAPVNSLEQLRGTKGWSVRDLAHKTGISKSTLGRIERGDTSPTVRQVKLIAQCFKHVDVAKVIQLLPECEQEDT